uniref:Phosphoribosylformylglycinamidine cyclo-ligase n=1 Tax=Chlamydomonas leiostraca TaxID=1034604 RepID=A0A6T8WWK2_9CHLO|eukprot:CAMPEP_0202869236 /NCGR_PEP_ID=MMETSP1391-20130828/12203_1 /ASSEMBLY_ACC=CAM_ASM_000867 /TAXON_ID=1034604 /ORGANISM="Chlamydomonas leiostraca, Strain SAG 11-49" /LENGTH=364 /DNA_ID=CAMNT_0049549529 /DNA_START=56 /DNA_END=1150 /DNA_ORIENTATION=+
MQTMQQLQSRQATARPVASVAPKAVRTHRMRSVAAAAPPKEGLTYKQAGVDIDAGDELVNRIKKMNPAMNTGFSGFVPFGDSYLVSGTDGVGTKLKLAFDMNKHDTVGIDLVAMSVNDVVTSGAQPLFFLDYFATGKLDVDQAEQVIKGIIEGCRQSNCQLLGGETAEMPGFYQKGEYDLAGFAVGAVKKDKLIDGKAIKAGDVVLAFKSSGVHSNGFSLVRKILEVAGAKLTDAAPWDAAKTIGQCLLEPTTIYVPRVVELHEKVGLKGVVHITGGGMTENIPRVIPKGLGVAVKVASYPVPGMFQWLQQAGNVPTDDMRRTFNMGVGMICVVDKEQVAAAQAVCPELWPLGEVVQGDGVTYV